MTVKEHLQKLHEDSAAHHQAVAKGHRKLAKLFGASGIESSDDFAAAHEGLAKCHDAAASNHSDMLKAVGDSMSKADLDHLVPDGVSGVLREWPPAITPVPRYGQRDISKADVAEEFKHLIAVEDD